MINLVDADRYRAESETIVDRLVERAQSELRLHSAMPAGSRMVAACISLRAALKAEGVEDSVAWSMAARMLMTP